MKIGNIELIEEYIETSEEREERFKKEEKIAEDKRKFRKKVSNVFKWIASLSYLLAFLIIGYQIVFENYQMSGNEAFVFMFLIFTFYREEKK